MEEWREIPGFPRYEASQDGKIRSKSRHTTKGNVLRPDERGFVTVKVKIEARELARLAWGTLK